MGEKCRLLSKILKLSYADFYNLKQDFGNDCKNFSIYVIVKKASVDGYGRDSSREVKRFVFCEVKRVTSCFISMNVCYYFLFCCLFVM